MVLMALNSMLSAFSFLLLIIPIIRRDLLYSWWLNNVHFLKHAIVGTSVCNCFFFFLVWNLFSVLGNNFHRIWTTSTNQSQILWYLIINVCVRIQPIVTISSVAWPSSPLSPSSPNMHTLDYEFLKGMDSLGAIFVSWRLNFVVVSLSCVRFFVTHGLQHARLLCPSPSPRVCSNSCPLSQRCHPIISSSVVPFSSCLQSFSASGSFPMSRLFA